MKDIKLFYWSSKVFEHKPQENYGDLLSKFIVEQVSGSRAHFFNALKQRKSIFKRSYLMGIGSILAHAQKKAVVWGSGIISREDSFQVANVYAVRGPLSRKRVLELGYECPEVYGDPALLLPLYYQPKKQPKRALGIIPHYVDYKQVKKQFDDAETLIIDLMTDDIFKTTDAICSCERIISSSLHGVIVAHAYGIPAIWVPFSNKLSGDNVKFEDYFLSVQLEPYAMASENEFLSTSDFNKAWTTLPSLPQASHIQQLQTGLLNAYPASYKNRI
ncbi:MAG: pyruvyl transferase [Psychroserpens sp.]|jgi:pyruvyltransferase